MVWTTLPIYSVPHPVVMVAQNWPFWLSTALSLSLPIERIHAQTRFRSMFDIPSKNKLIPSWYPLGDIMQSLLEVDHAFILGSGSFFFLTYLPRSIVRECRGFIFAIEVDMHLRKRERDYDR